MSHAWPRNVPQRDDQKWPFHWLVQGGNDGYCRRYFHCPSSEVLSRLLAGCEHIGGQLNVHLLERSPTSYAMKENKRPLEWITVLLAFHGTCANPYSLHRAGEK
jgi:hypothetical protein